MRKSVQIVVALCVFSLHIASYASPADERVETLINELGDRDYGVYSQAITELVKIGKPAVEPLIKALIDEYEDVCAKTLPKR